MVDNRKWLSPEIYELDGQLFQILPNYQVIKLETLPPSELEAWGEACS